MENVFLVDACVKKEELQGYSGGIQNYLERNDIRMGTDQMLLIGRALTDFDIENILFTPNGNPISIYGFHLYGHLVDFISEGCTCVMICSVAKEELTAGSILRLS